MISKYQLFGHRLSSDNLPSDYRHQEEQIKADHKVLQIHFSSCFHSLSTHQARIQIKCIGRCQQTNLWSI